MTIRYNKPFEVTRAQYAVLMNRLAGVVAGRYDQVEKKFYIKVWVMREVSRVYAILASKIK